MIKRLAVLNTLIDAAALLLDGGLDSCWLQHAY